MIQLGVRTSHAETIFVGPIRKLMCQLQEENIMTQKFHKKFKPGFLHMRCM